MYVVKLSEAAKVLGRQGCGSKAYGLSQLLNSGYPVPNGFVVTKNAFEAVWKKRQNNSQTRSSVPDLLDFPSELLKELLPAFSQLVHRYGAVSVRSSSNMEDLNQASFAGQYETFLNVQTQRELFSAILKCFSSLTSERAVQYAAHQRIDLQNVYMPILVQGMVHADQSGVGFSVHPVTMEDRMLVNVAYGIGEAVVSGLVTPDTFEFDRSTGKITKQLGFKEIKIVMGEHGVLKQETSPREQSEFCISETNILELCTLMGRLEEQFGVPVDVEFAFQNGELFILQVRPITTRWERNGNELSI